MPILPERPRRMRKNTYSRLLMRENSLTPADLIYPVFVIEGEKKCEKIPAMPDVYRLSIDLIIDEAKTLAQLGIPAMAIFPVINPQKKSLDASESYQKNGLVQRAISEIKNATSNIALISDVALDPYTSHGQDGIIDKNNHILNDETVEILIKQALSHAQAGADIIAPSDMMDGRIGIIRDALEKNNFINTQILAYSAKYASNYYTPFRDAIGSAKNLGMADKKTYQMDFANSDEALREVALDIKEGADMVMIKPGIAYLDIIYRVKQKFNFPTFAYQVSGEYTMIKVAAEKGFIDEKAIVFETLLAFKRAGADAIFSYYAKKVAQWLQNEVNET